MYTNFIICLMQNYYSRFSCIPFNSSVFYFFFKSVCKLNYYSWQVTVWDECSKSCDGGVQYRQVHCQRSGPGDSFVIVNDSQCLENDGPKPVYARACNDVPCPTWKVGEWSTVSI